MMKIYTKTGDNGTTSLFGGKRVKKSDPRVDLYGHVDELSCFIGFSASLIKNSVAKKNLQNIQQNLMTMACLLANPLNKSSGAKPKLEQKKVTELERQIDVLQKSLPPLKKFILPGGSPVSASLHVARAVCRRVERNMVAFAQKNAVTPVFISYLNRLSDYLFVLARASTSSNKAGNRLVK